MKAVNNLGKYLKSSAQRKKISESVKRLYLEGKKSRYNAGSFKKGHLQGQQFIIGHVPWNKGKHLTEDMKQEMGIARKGKGLHKGHAFGGFDTQFKKGEKHPFYNPDKQRDYGMTKQSLKETHDEFKRRINYICQYKNCDKCHNSQLPGRKLNVHHKNGNKRDYSPENIIVYCIPRHISEQWKIQKYPKT